MKKLMAIFGTSMLALSSSTTVFSCSKEKDLQQHKDSKFNFLENEVQIAIGDLKRGIDGSSLSENNNIADAFELIVKQILVDCPEIEDIKLIDENKMESYLKAGDNPIEISFNIKNKPQKLKTVVKNVQSIIENNEIKDHAMARFKIEQILKSVINAKNLYEWNTIFDALEYFKNEIKKINKNANVRFSTSWLKKRMGKIIDEFSKEKIETKSERQSNKNLQIVTANIDVGSWIGAHIFGTVGDWINQLVTKMLGITPAVKWTAISASVIALFGFSGALKPLLNFVKDTSAKILNYINEKGEKVFTSIRTWFYDKFYYTKHTKPTFLSANNLETFDLHLYFDNDEKEIKKAIENSHNNIAEETIKTSIVGVQPRSRENAKKIIEKQTYIFNQPLTYQQVIEQVKEHIKTTMFPDDAEQDKFEFKAVFKNLIDKDKILQPGLNKIELVLNPKQTAANWFRQIFGTKKPIDINLQVEYKK